jgi:hypothetical protein
MDPYLKRYNNYVNIPEILTASGKRMSDLPTLPKYCHPAGQSFLCWNCVLGRCFHGPRCRFARGHLFRRRHRRHQQRGSTFHKPPGRGGRWRLPHEQTQRGELAPLRIPDYGQDRVLSDATRRQSTKESHLTANSRSLSGMIGGLGRSENAMQGCKAHGTVGVFAGQ